MTVTTYLCPKGHDSTEADYCSECGAKINGIQTNGIQTNGAATSAAPLQVAGMPETCPECGVPREGEDVGFCEICGYNFVTGARGEVPVMPAVLPEPVPAIDRQPEPLPGADIPSAMEVSPDAPQAWEVTVTVDPALREAGSPEPPAGVGPFVFPLTEPVSLIGRRSETRAIFPHIPLTHDAAVSHRHALLQLEPGKALLLRDIGASNGTRLNGAEIAPMVDHPLKDGDEITLGHWSRIAVRVIR